MHLADAFIQSDLHSSYSFYISTGLAFPGNRTHDLGVASAMLYQLSYRKANSKLCGKWGFEALSIIVRVMSPSRMLFLSAVLCVALFHLISGQNCSEHCKACGGLEKDQCLQCHTGFILHDNLCVGESLSEMNRRTVRSIHLVVCFILNFTSTLLH